VEIRQIRTVEHVLANDIAYILLQKDVLNLMAIMDLHSRHVLDREISNRLDREVFLDTPEMAL